MALLLTRPEREMAAADAELRLLSSGEMAAASQQGAAPPAESGTAAPGTDFASCYAKEMPGLVWFVMSLGAGPEAAADAAQSAFADAFPVWYTIRYPHAWLRRVAERAYYRRVSTRETFVETPPTCRGRCRPPAWWSCVTRRAPSWPRWRPFRRSSDRSWPGASTDTAPRRSPANSVLIPRRCGRT